MNKQHEWFDRKRVGSDWTDGDDIVIREKPAEDVSCDGSYAEEVQDKEHHRMCGLIGVR